MIKVVLKWFLLSILDKLFGLIALILSPVTSIFVDQYGNLPKFLSWFQTPDSNMFGADGDIGFRDRNKHLIGSFIGRWWVCIKWQWRNTGQGFSMRLGLDEYVMIVDRSIWENDGIHFERVRAYQNGKLTGFEEWGGWKWTKNRYFRYRLGWKFGFSEGKGKTFKAMLANSITPFKKLD